MANPDAVVDELMAHIEVYADERLSSNADNVALFKESLTDAIRTALLNVAREGLTEGYDIGWEDSGTHNADDAWLNSKTRAALEGK